MHRLLVAPLAAVDALVAAAVGIAAALAPLTAIWVFGFGGGADWAALWPTAGGIFQLGHLVPLTIALPTDFVVAAGIEPDAATFVLSLAPLAFASFTAIFAARSGTRAAGAGAAVTGVITGGAVFLLAAAGIALTARTDVATGDLAAAILLPAALYVLPAAIGATVVLWRDDDGLVGRWRMRLGDGPGAWGRVIGVTARGAAAALVALVGLGALGVTAALIAGGGQIIALYQSANVDALGATVVTLAQLAYLPTLVVWSAAFIAGPGFALGEGTAVSPAGTELGVLPGLPVLGAIPETVSPWLLLLALLPVGAGAFAGWIVRSRLVLDDRQVAEPARPVPSVSPASLAGSPLLTVPAPKVPDAPDGREPMAPRLAAVAAIAGVAAAAAALAAIAASGSIGPGSLAHVGPAPGPFALAIGLEVAVGAGILLLAPIGRHRRHGREAADAGAERREAAGEPPVD